MNLKLSKRKGFMVLLCIVVLLVIVCLLLSTKFLNIKEDNIKKIEVFNSLGIGRMSFTDKKVIEETVDILNGYMLKDSSRHELRGSMSPTTVITIYYDGDDDGHTYEIYSEGIICCDDTQMFYKRYGWELIDEELTKLFIKYEHLGK